MRKSCVVIILFFGLQTVALSQNKQTMMSVEMKSLDSLKQKLALATDDSIRVRILEDIGFNYEISNLDSSLKYTQAGLALATERGYAWGEAALMASLGGVLRQQGKLGESLDFLYKALKIAETSNTTREIGRACRRLADIYFDLENFQKGIEYLMQALEADERNQYKASVVIDYMTLGYAYEKMNKLDTALLYTNMAFQQKDLVKKLMQYVYGVAGNIQVKKGNYEEAVSFFREGLRLSQEYDDFLTTSTICADISALYLKLDKKDSATFYALRGFQSSQKTSFKKGTMLSGYMLAEVYDSLQPAAALNYFKIASAAKDSIFGVSNIQAIQNLVSQEEARKKELEAAKISYRNRLKSYGLLTGLAVLLIIAFILYRNNRQKQTANVLLQQQKDKIEITLSDLKSAQAQLVQSEKMASLGELTAGIAHEIQNPLNFVNNFSEISNELMSEMKAELDKGDIEEAKLMATDIQQNLEKINHHGKRADSIVKGMLQHSRKSAGVKEFVNINKLADEYLRLAYHGLRAKDSFFNVTMKTDFDETTGNITIIAQDTGRVLLNLYNNAFYAVNEKKKTEGAGYEPVVAVSTKTVKTSSGGSGVLISVKDNGNGIPRDLVDKIFQPFFTTKPTGQGTGLGLSMSYDIVKVHGGEIKVESKEGAFTEFTIILPV